MAFGTAMPMPSIESITPQMGDTLGVCTQLLNDCFLAFTLAPPALSESSHRLLAR
jgi:hypothetical protein